MRNHNRNEWGMRARRREQATWRTTFTHLRSALGCMIVGWGARAIEDTFGLAVVSEYEIGATIE